MAPPAAWADIDRLVTRAGGHAAALWAEWLAGRISATELADILGALVASASTLSARLSYERIALWALGAGAELVAPAELPAIAHATDVGRLTRGVGTITGAVDLAEPEAIAAGLARLVRLVRSEPYEAAQRVAGDLVEGSAGGWTRGLNPGACQLCEWWSREGRVWPSSYRLQTHKGCECWQDPTTERPTSVPYGKYHEYK